MYIFRKIVQKDEKELVLVVANVKINWDYIDVGKS